MSTSPRARKFDHLVEKDRQILVKPEIGLTIDPPRDKSGTLVMVDSVQLKQ